MVGGGRNHPAAAPVRVLVTKTLCFGVKSQEQWRVMLQLEESSTEAICITPLFGLSWYDSKIPLRVSDTRWDLTKSVIDEAEVADLLAMKAYFAAHNGETNELKEDVGQGCEAD